MINIYGNTAQCIQNRTNWCWAAACKVVGEQYKRQHTEFAFHIIGENGIGLVSQQEYETGVLTQNLDGLRKEFVTGERGLYFIDAWQRAIVMNANRVQQGTDGNFSGDDAAKLCGLRYAVTGKCQSSLVHTVSIWSV